MDDSDRDAYRAESVRLKSELNNYRDELFNCRDELNETQLQNEKLKEEIARLKPQFEYCTMGSLHPDDLPRALERAVWHGATAKPVERTLESLLAELDISYFTEGPLHRFTFDTVTVLRCEGKEASIRVYQGIWRTLNADGCFGPPSYNRDEAESWCVEQLLPPPPKPPEPKWRPAREDGSDNGKECRVKSRGKYSEWNDRILAGHDTRVQGGPWIAINATGGVGGWEFCEVRDE